MILSLISNKDDVRRILYHERQWRNQYNTRPHSDIDPALQTSGQEGDSGRHRVSHRPTTAWTRAAFAAIVLLLSLAAPVAAGPLEDAYAAHSRGDFATALRLYRPLADQGVASAQLKLGLIYDLGQGVPQNHAEAMKWYRLAADQGYASAQHGLGTMYHFGQGVPQNYDEARKWYRLAADQGYASAQSSLGGMYYFGRGVPQDYGEALKWLRLAASQSDARAQSLLGLMYYGDYLRTYGRALERARRGEPVDRGDNERSSQSWAEASKWFRLAADQGDALAQSSLGSMYQGSNNVLSHMWFNLAAAQGDERHAKARDDVAMRMTPAQIAEAQKLAREWQSKRP
jgi:TPR repeat protein